MNSMISIDFTRITNFIPKSMKQLPNWGLWRLMSDKNNRLTKVPFAASFRGNAKSNDPATWSCYEIARAEYDRSPEIYQGLAFFTDGKGLVFIDIDHCISEEGELNDQAAEIMHLLGDAPFWEVSQSGTGLHGFMFGTIENSFNNRRYGVEVYSDKKFCAMTGRALFKREPGRNDEGLRTVCEKYQTWKGAASRGAGDHVPVLRRSDSYIIEKASSNEKSGELFRQLMSGDVTGFQSHSEADFCLIKILWFWSDGDADAVKRIVRSSGLYRSKLDREDYLNRTIAKAAEESREVLSGYISRREREKRDERFRYLVEQMQRS